MNDKKLYEEMSKLNELVLHKGLVPSFEEIINQLEKQKEIINKIKEKGVMYYDPEYSKIYGELCSMAGANNTRTPVIVIDDEILELLEEIE